MQGSRNYHTKSRNGCRQCKRRRVKCNLQAPICDHCKRRGEACDYQLLGFGGSSTSVDQPAFPGQVCSQLQVKPRAEDEAPWTQKRGLLSSNIGVMVSLYLEDWADFQYRLAHEMERHLFLQEIFSSVSALESVYSQRINRLEMKESCPDSRALQHQVAASGIFRDSVHLITDENWLAVLAFIVSTLVVHFDQEQRMLSELDMGATVQSMHLLRHSALLGRQLHPWLFRSGLVARVQRKVMSDIPPWDYPAEQAFFKLTEINRILNAPTTVCYEICEDAIGKLQLWLQSVSGQPRTWLHFVWWPGEIPLDYLQLLSRENPVAIIILLHWCAVMTKAPRRWFVQDWARKIARSVMSGLRAEWFDEIGWAMTQLAAGI